MLDELNFYNESEYDCQEINKDIVQRLSMLPSPILKILYPYDIDIRNVKRPDRQHFAAIKDCKNIGNLGNNELMINDDLWIHHLDSLNIKLRNTKMHDAILYNIKTDNIYLNNAGSENLILCNIIVNGNLDMRKFHYSGYCAIVDVKVKGTLDIRGMDTDNLYIGGVSDKNIKIHDKIWTPKRDYSRKRIDEQGPVYNLNDLIYN